jgi:hypothetical protein
MEVESVVAASNSNSRPYNVRTNSQLTDITFIFSKEQTTKHKFFLLYKLTATGKGHHVNQITPSVPFY